MPKKNTKKNHTHPNLSRSRKGSTSKSSNNGEKVARSIGTAIGAALGAKLGVPKVGAILGGTAAAKMSRLIGHGDYDVGPMPVTNSLVKRGSASSSFGNDLMNTFRVRRREFVKNVMADETSFSIDAVTCQPGLTEPFPYLSTIGRSFVKYSVEGLVYEYISNVSSYSSVPAMGSVIMTFDPNQGSAPPSNKIAIENMAGAVSCRPDRNMVYGVECAKHLTPFKQYFVRTGFTPDQATVAEDFGTFYIASSGLPASVYTKGIILGELWVTYDIIFDTPKLPTLESGFYNYYGTGVTTTNELGTLSSQNSGGVLYDTYVSGAARDVLSFRNVAPGSVVSGYIFITGGEGQSFSINVAELAGLVYEPIFTNGSGALVGSANVANASGRVMFYFAVRVLTSIPTEAGFSDPSIRFSVTGTNPTTPSMCNIIVYTLGQGQSFSSIP